MCEGWMKSSIVLLMLRDIFLELPVPENKKKHDKVNENNPEAFMNSKSDIHSKEALYMPKIEMLETLYPSL